MRSSMSTSRSGAQPRRGWVTTFSLAASLATGAGVASAADGFLLTSDYGHQRVRVQDITSDKVVYDLPIASSRINPVCALSMSLCSPMSVQYNNHGGRDFVDVAVMYSDFHLGPGLMTLPSFIGRYELTTPPRRVFLLENLDFRDVPDYELYCDQAPDEAFGDRGDAGCRLSFAHGVKIVEDHPESSWISYVVADAFNGRIVQVSLEYAQANAIAHVDWVLGDDNPDWPRNGLPNAVQHISDDDGDYLLVTFYTNGEVPGASAGSLIMYQMTDLGWSKVWAFPDEDAGEQPFLHAVHMGQIITDPTSGRRWLFYSHGRALATSFGTNQNTDLGGAAGVLKLGASLADPPTYLGEGVPFLDQALANQADPPYRYARDVEFTEEGYLILGDASCENSCPEPAQHFMVQPFMMSLAASPLAGYYSSTHEQQELVDISGGQVLRQMQCGHSGLFESHYVARKDAGRQLRQAATKATVTCASESATPTPAPPPTEPAPRRR